MERIANIEHVLLNEVDNPNSVFLYLEGDVWCAYERSAYYLTVIKASAILEKEVIGDNGYDVVLLKASFGMDEMTFPLSPGVILKSVADDKLQFRMMKPVDGFNEWKEKELKRLSA